MKTFSLIRAKTLIISVALTLAGLAYAGPPDEDIINKMEDHWEKLINEEDAKSRSKMMIEHRKMMEDTKKSLGITSHHGDHSGGHHHMLNTFDMHESMLDMME